ncbi:hypothetical protein JAAARDRAFT_177545 [Jaapia argillacea MUCL 33604]|uniref:U3 small nucleolar RNA-associated protein 25 n=1 Tax=Jaapia argillacea MUCL 33604 TaxID=933084 RepID=A0A067PUB9_9AGAM|nr:hypothetical protein JAAARDRAFT_177545 [Jaapia argillacea MUCL 33604]
MSDGNTTTTRLLTLLNVSATKSHKRKWVDEVSSPPKKLNKRKSTSFNVSPLDAPTSVKPKVVEVLEEGMALSADDDEPAQGLPDAVDDAETEVSGDPYEVHFGTDSTVFTEVAKADMDQRALKSTKEQHGKLGTLISEFPRSCPEPTKKGESTRAVILDRLKTPFIKRQQKVPKDHQEIQNDLLDLLSSQRDVYLNPIPLEVHHSIREAIALHALNHVTRKRRRVLKNNERISHAAKANMPPPEDVQDQGFTRPSILILLPFRNSALNWMNALTSHTPRPEFQIENHARFLSEFGLPDGTVDKLASAKPGTYPPDHVQTFSGNVDDNFRIGVKLTRKSVRLFAEFYGCDIIFASPLGLRMSIEKEKNGDFLSSIEMLIVDQLDALTMQNWEHVQFVFSNLGKLPKESHDADFSRIKSWYLDGNGPYLRQSILLSSYETPEIRSLFNTSLKNVAGRLRSERRWLPIVVPEGIHQDFVQFNCSSPKDEPDKRFHHFTTQLLPSVLKSAVQSVNTVIFIPSSFDFIRVQNYLRKREDVSFTVLSEYSSNQEISRARQAFFAGQKPFLLVSERFHFFRRYKIRGIRNVIFYGPPDHPQFYTEFLSYPFLDEDVDPSDVTCRLLYSKYDWFRLERIAGTESAIDLVKRDSL